MCLQKTQLKTSHMVHGEYFGVCLMIVFSSKSGSKFIVLFGKNGSIQRKWFLNDNSSHT